MKCKKVTRCERAGLSNLFCILRAMKCKKDSHPFRIGTGIPFWQDWRMRRQAERGPACALPAFLGRGHRLGRWRRDIASGLAFFLTARRRGWSPRCCCGRFFLAHVMLLVVEKMLRRRGCCVQLYANCGRPQANWRLQLSRPCADQAAA